MDSLDFNKPVQTGNGENVRVLCVDAGGEFPVVAMIGGEIVRFTLNGIAEGGEVVCWLENSPPPEKFYVNISEDGSYVSDIQGLTYTPTTMAQLIVDPENKNIRIQAFNDCVIETVGQKQKKEQTPRKKNDGDLMSGYFNNAFGKKNGTDLSNVEIVDGDMKIE